MSIELKIKSKHLGLEAKVIKFEEEKLKRQIRWFCNKLMPVDTKLVWKLNSLTNHRKWDVRNENRATFLARAFIAGVPYKTVEHKCKDVILRTMYIMPRVLSMVTKYHNRKITEQDLHDWVHA